MLRYDNHPSRQRDVIAQRQAVLDTIVDYRFFAPAKIAADELCERELARAALARVSSHAAVAPRRWAEMLRRRLGAALVDVGGRLQGNTAADLEPQPET